jgi:hypothetical protein
MNTAPEAGGMRHRMALLYGIGAVAGVSIVAYLVLAHYSLAFRDPHMDKVFAAKLTFLSFAFAAFAFQYGYFFQMRWTEGQKVKGGEVGWIRQARELLADAKRSGRTDPAVEKWKTDIEKYVAEEPEKYLQAMAARNRPMFTAAFSLLLALLTSLFFSVVFDFCWLVARNDIAWLRTASAATFSAALAIFGVGGGLGIFETETGAPEIL